MKFGEYLRSNATSEWKMQYLDYDKLKKLIKILEDQHIGVQHGSGIGTSLSVPLPTNAAGMPRSLEKGITQEEFFTFLESEMRKIESFTKEQVDSIREVLRLVEEQVASHNCVGTLESVSESLRIKVEAAGEQFLKCSKIFSSVCLFLFLWRI